MDKNAAFATIGIQSCVAKWNQQCVQCRRTIRKDDTAYATALNIITKQPVWMHENCARFIKHVYTAPHYMIDDGWRQVSAPQRCYQCKKMVNIGSKIYRVWPGTFDPSDTGTIVLTQLCHTCWQIDVASYLEE